MEPGADWLSDLLQHVQLEQFYLPIRDQLQITRLAHFDYVHADDLEKIGISKPGVRRLFDAVRKRKLLLWNRKFWNKLFGSSSLSREKTDLALKPAPTETRTTCIILEKDLVLHNELGNGSFGVVKRGEWKVSDQQTLPVAVKVLKADAFTQPGIYDDFRREMEAMHSLKHSNLIKLHGVVFHPLMMVCELAPMGALLDYIRAQDGKVSLNYISKWSEQVAAGMAHLEKNRFLHRDLACRNILLSNLELVKIGDFGLMRALPSSDDCYVMSERRRVPFPWCAPESLRTRQFSHASDVWMFAVALWEMYSFGEEPWIGLNGSEILRLIMREGQRLSAPAACPPDVYMLMMQCWDLNPKERPTFAGILRYMDTNKFETAVASLSYKKQGQMSMDSGDTIILIDKRPELHSWKGQNQRTLEVGLFPSTLVSVSIRKSKKPSPKKADTLSGPRGNLVSPKSTPILNGSRDDVVLRNRRTIESTQPTFTRSGNSGSKHFNYNKLVNDRAGLHTHRAQRDAYSKSLNHVREDLLIDLDLPPATGQNMSQNKTLTQEISLLDQPIDVPESGLEVDWGEQSIESLPSFSSAAASYAQSATNLNGARSVDNLSLSMGSPDPFDTSHFWPVNNHSPAKTTVNRTRPNYAIQLAGTSAAQHRNEESHRYSTNSIPTTVFDTKIYNNVSNSIVQNLGIESIYDSSKSRYSGSVNSCTVPNSITNVLNEHASVESGVATAIASMSLDDRISESLNLRTKNTNDENIYMNSAFNDAPSTSSANVPNNDRYKDIPIYNNTSYEINPVEQQFLLETKDYYTKFSTPVKSEDDYSKNIYVPKHEDDGKLHNFSDDLQNSKNYSSKKYQNVEYSQYGAGYSADSHWSEYTDYDEEHGTDTNIYSEIPEPSNTRVNQTYSNINRVYSNTSQAVYSSNSINNQPVYSSSGTSSQPIYSTNPNDFSNSSALYDEVYESVAPRPHRPAPPRPTNPK